jgi:hypothetical protein
VERRARAALVLVVLELPLGDLRAQIGELGVGEPTVQQRIDVRPRRRRIDIVSVAGP